MSGRNVIGVDLGGTKIAAALVSPSGRILRRSKEPTILAKGWPGLRAQIIRLCQGLGPARAVGIASAGPLHAPSGTLLDPTNFGWKTARSIPLTRELGKALRLPVTLENDAAAAALGEQWRGGGGSDFLVLTLGTGLGMGVICDGALVRGGRGLHPEGGHILLHPGDRSAPCGCGNFGCAEAYLSGRSFNGRRGKRSEESHYAEYSVNLAAYLHDLVVLYYPRQVIFSGSFARTHARFLPQARVALAKLLRRRLKTLPLLPKLRATRLGDNSGILGAASIALR